MDYHQVQQTFEKIIEGHRKGYSDLQQAANLLEMFWRQLSEERRKDMIGVMWNTLSAEPLRPLAPAEMVTPNIHRVLIRAISAFGPTSELPARVFARLVWSDVPAMEYWAQHLCNELSYSMFHNAQRFSQATLDQAKGYCATYSYEQAAQLAGTTFPQKLVDAVRALEKSIDYVEYGRFEAGIKMAQQESEDRHLAEGTPASVQGIPPKVAAAMKRAKQYLGSSDPFDAKAAADLIRASMDEAHRAVVSELEEMTGRKYEHPNKDGFRRAYMRDAAFISRAEEVFFSAIYTLLSEEAAHKILAPKETVLVMETTVESYLHLLFRRLEARKVSAPDAS